MARHCCPAILALRYSEAVLQLKKVVAIVRNATRLQIEATIRELQRFEDTVYSIEKLVNSSVQRKAQKHNLDENVHGLNSSASKLRLARRQVCV